MIPRPIRFSKPTRVVLTFLRPTTGSILEIETYRKDMPVFVESFNGFEISHINSYPKDTRG